MAELSQDLEQLFERAVSGNRSALARLLSFVERGGKTARAIGAMSYRRSGTSYTIGITGAPGAGKSTLTNGLIGHVRSLGAGIAVLAIDPSSPFSGGAILGDRVRMQDHATDDGVFIRSMATRGHLGGLSLATPEAVRLLDAVGWSTIIVETVGVGQVEVDIAASADTTVVVVNPGWGDSVQAAKAGLMEIADVFVINKADRPGVAATERDLQAMLDLAGSRVGGWRPPIVQTVASQRRGNPEVWAAIDAHRRSIESSGTLARRREQRVSDELQSIITERLEAKARTLMAAGGWEKVRTRIDARELDLWAAADEILDPLDT